MTVETLRDYMPGKAGVVGRWLEELETAGTWQKEWEDRSREIIKLYEGEISTFASSSFNVLHSNTETLRPVLFGAVPNPDIRRRVQVPAPVEREAAEIIERCLRYLNDTSPYAEQVDCMLSDLLLTGRGVMRIRYVPTIVKRQEPLTMLSVDDTDRFFTANNNEIAPENVITIDEQPFVELEELHFERADKEHVPYNDFRHTPAKRWADVRWIAFRHLFTRDELKQSFGRGAAERTSLTVQVEGKGARRTNDLNAQPDIFMRAEVWEIWDKTERQIIFVSPGNETGPLATYQDGPDYYNLREFFPTCEPIRTINTPRTLLPIPEYVIYQDLAVELNEITSRIRNIVETIEVRGAYDGALPQLGEIFRNRNRLLSVPDWRALTDKGGLQGVMDFIDIKPQVDAFVALTQQREVLLNTIYQVIGLSDIQRAQSDPRETATAQRLKGQYGGLRIAPRQRAVQRYLRDLMRIQAELVAEKFEPQTISLMSGGEISEEILLLLRLDPLRNFAIDIETDSTIAADQRESQQEIGEMLQGLTAYASAAAGLPEAARLPLLQAITRRFKLGRDVELALEEAAQQPPEPDPQTVAEAQKAQLEQQKLQLQAVDSEREFMLEAQELALKAQELGLKADEAEAQILLALGQLFGGRENERRA